MAGQASVEPTCIARELFLALREDDPSAFVQGDPASPSDVTVDGTFNLVAVAERLIARVLASPRCENPDRTPEQIGAGFRD